MQLTTTSYAILGLLDLRDWSAYELAQQAGRSLAFAWPVSQTQLYAEPKRLAREGLITVEERAAGPVRQRQVFSITATGRAALRAWLATEPAPPTVRVEALLRCLLATSGTTEDLQRSLAATRASVEASYAAGMAMVEEMVAGPQPFPERLHANVLWMSFVRDLLRLLATWTDDAAAEVATWTDVRTGGDPVRAQELLAALPRPLPPGPTNGAGTTKGAARRRPSDGGG